MQAVPLNHSCMSHVLHWGQFMSFLQVIVIFNYYSSIFYKCLYRIMQFNVIRVFNFLMFINIVWHLWKKISEKYWLLFVDTFFVIIWIHICISVLFRLSSLTELEELHLCYNELDSPFPRVIGVLINLRELRLTWCGVKDVPQW